MKLMSLMLFIGLCTISNAQQIKVEVSGNIFNCDADSVHISQYFGDRYEDLAGSKLKKSGDFKIKTNLENADYYVLRIGQTHLNLILRDSSNIKVYGDGKNIGQFANIVGSDESSNMNQFIRVKNDWQILVDSANTAIVNADPAKQASLKQKMQKKQQEYQASVRTFVQENQNSASLLAIQSIIDPNTDFEGYENITRQMYAGFSESPTVQELYSNMEKQKNQRTAADPLGQGKMAPDFTEALANGEMMSLSDLRGQVVLLDFWASWCGPCRRENPNVVALYEKYKEKGFTVMSVSLDKDKAKWLQAIEKDNLTWPNHVSDLKFWQSKAAKLYGVSGIPFTVLIDQEGKIIRTKLRGPQLEEELSRIFGDS
jgi:peroxiredoxin